MPRLTETSLTPAERRAYQRLLTAMGFAPKVLFGRDSNGNAPILQRVLEPGIPVLYALAPPPNGQPWKRGVREFRLLVAPVQAASATTAAPRSFTKQQRATIAAGVKKSWAKRRAKYGTRGHSPRVKTAETSKVHTVTEAA